MASDYSTSLKIQLVGNGDQAGTWGSTTNNNWNLMEQAVSGVGSITMINTDYTLSSLNGVIDEARNAVLVVNGANSAVRKVIIPLVEKNYDITNNTTGGYAITVGGITGSFVTIPNGGSMALYCDGTNTYFANTMATTPSRGDSSNLIATTEFVQNSLPAGMIMLWSGSVLSIPSGWIICDGANGTPDLRNRFILGAGNSYAPGATGGSDTTTLSAANIPAHTHTFSGTTSGMNANNPHNHGVNDPGHAHSLGVDRIGSPGTGGTNVDLQGGGGSNCNLHPGNGTSSSGTGISIASANIEHGHNFSGTTSSFGSGDSFTNMPPYYALCYVMKV